MLLQQLDSSRPLKSMFHGMNPDPKCKNTGRVRVQEERGCAGQKGRCSGPKSIARVATEDSFQVEARGTTTRGHISIVKYVSEYGIVKLTACLISCPVLYTG